MKTVPFVYEDQFEMVVVMQWMLPFRSCKMRDFEKFVLNIPLHTTQNTNNPCQYTNAGPVAAGNFEASINTYERTT
ncbi:hypothetical protein [Chitinophaga pinensis]|uniref:hypothetical protein n=1 Tax=Chitinophaga pinensis TaxID=79329 RepID=UPI001C992945|nr:hypothetical protein [Chitinophaga pinensis]